MIRLASLALFAAVLLAKDDQRLALLRQAQDSFNRVEKAASAQLADASACVQAQAAMMPVALPAELELLHFHKGFCQLAVAAITRNGAGFTEAAAELDQGNAKTLAWLARLQVNPAAPPPQLPGDRANIGFPRTERLWLGWIAWRSGDLDQAARRFAGQDETGWPAWAAGLQAFREARYHEAAADYAQAVDAWTRARRDPSPALMTRLAPPADLPQALTDLGGAQLLSGDLAAAVSTLNTALEAGPDARAFYYRARAHELAGQAEASLADYNLAGRAAFASAQELSTGEAHLYRGILLYRRKDFLRAEDEFTSALNLDIPEALRPDASAWRHLSAVAAGFCASSRESLARSLSAVSPFFPKDEARTLAAGCATVQGKMASRSVNKVILLGHLGKDAETKFTPSGVARTSFTLATNRRWKDQQSGEWKEETDWHNCIIWRSENVATYLQKGKQVYVEGRLQTRSYEQDGQKKYFTEVVCDDLILLSSRGGEGGGPEPVSMPRSQRPAPAPAAAPAAPAADEFNQGITDDDVPF
ncbi:MAG: single-stranded DNA-binding protein [Bryobacteraceae bacterium]